MGIIFIAVQELTVIGIGGTILVDGHRTDGDTVIRSELDLLWTIGINERNQKTIGCLGW